MKDKREKRRNDKKNREGVWGVPAEGQDNAKEEGRCKVLHLFITGASFQSVQPVGSNVVDSHMIIASTRPVMSVKSC